MGVGVAEVLRLAPEVEQSPGCCKRLSMACVVGALPAWQRTLQDPPRRKRLSPSPQGYIIQQEKLLIGTLPPPYQGFHPI